MTDNPVVAVDLFCGGGGLSEALASTCEDLERAQYREWREEHGKEPLNA